MNKLDEIRDLLTLNINKMNDVIRSTELLRKKKLEEDGEKKPLVRTILVVVGIVAVAACAVYFAYRFFSPDFENDFEDDLDDDFDDDFFEDEEEEEKKEESKEEEGKDGE